MADPQYGTLMDYLAQLPDPRQARGQRFPYGALLSLLVAALAAGQQGPTAMARWAQGRAQVLAAALGLRDWRMPSEGTFRRLLKGLAAGVVEALVSGHNQAVLAGQPALAWRGRDGLSYEVWALDGKVLCGASHRGPRVWLLTLAVAGSGVVLAEQRVPVETNEIPVARELLRGWDLSGKVIAVDALLAQRDLAAQITAQGGHYLMVIKGNQPSCEAGIAELFATPSSPSFDPEREHTTRREQGHGRWEERFCECSEELVDWLEWPAAQQVVHRRNLVLEERRGRAREVRDTYAVTSLSGSQAGPAHLLDVWRERWGIENRVFWRRDAVFGEDACGVHRGDRPQVLAALRNGLLAAVLAQDRWANLPDAIAWANADPVNAMQLIGAL